MRISTHAISGSEVGTGQNHWQKLVEAHLALAGMIARRLRLRLPPCVDVDDLESDAYLGLLKAARTFDPDRGVLFRTFAAPRIRGAILDGLRQRNGRLANRPHFVSLNSQVRVHRQLFQTLGDTLASDSEPVGKALEDREEAEVVMKRLDRQSRQQLVDRHVEGLQHKQIALKLGITASAVSQRMKGIYKLIEEIRCQTGR